MTRIREIGSCCTDRRLCQRMLLLKYNNNNNNESIFIAPCIQVTLFKGAVTKLKNPVAIKIYNIQIKNKKFKKVYKKKT